MDVKGMDGSDFSWRDLRLAESTLFIVLVFCFILFGLEASGPHPALLGV